MKTNKTKISFFAFFLVLFCFTACNGNADDEKIVLPHDTSKPVVIASLSPEEGGLATQVILRGSNFGNDISKIEVWFNEKKAYVIGTSGDRLLVETPRQPGDTCNIKVVIGNKEVIAPKQFVYHTTVNVSTIAGQKGTSEFLAGKLATATFGQPHRITVDLEGNIFGAHRSSTLCWMLNEAADVVMQLPNVTPNAGAPTVDKSGRIITFPDDAGDAYYTFDATMGWAGKKSLILHPTALEQMQEGRKDFKIDYKTSFATGPDGMIYTFSFGNGQLVRFDPRTRKGELVSTMPNATGTHGMLEFHPVNKHILYIALIQKNAFVTYNLETEQWEIYAGTVGVNGWRDGDRLDAQFSDIGQFVFDEDLNIVLSDAGNHCIRQISPDGQVSTLIGTPKVAGYRDGNPDEALFNWPRGMCIDKDYNIYISDTYNNCIRKLSIE